MSVFVSELLVSLLGDSELLTSLLEDAELLAPLLEDSPEAVAETYCWILILSRENRFWTAPTEMPASLAMAGQSGCKTIQLVHSIHTIMYQSDMSRHLRDVSKQRHSQVRDTIETGT